MILIFGSSLYKKDPQNELLLGELKEKKKDFFFVNPLIYSDIYKMRLVQKGSSVKLYHSRNDITPNTVFVSRIWRQDCIIDIPEECEYPTFFRNKIFSFLNEIRFALSDITWFPGKYENIEKGDAKLILLKMAKDCGLQTPSITINSFDKNPENLLYRKVLGYPFSITFSKEDKEETSITLFNKENLDNSNHNAFPWQWQKTIKTKFLIRCVVVEEKIWSYRANTKQLKNMSMREAQLDDIEIKWTKCKLSKNIMDGLVLLMKKLNLKFACPEFLVDYKNNFIFIDLNPCGDWFGFPGKKDEKEIVSEIVSKL